jgi:TonB family protein
MLTRKVEDDELAVPLIEKNDQLRVGRADYPDASKAMHQQGDCTIRASVLEDGTVSRVSVRKSTDFATLDQACLVAVHQAPFIPPRRNGVASAAFADIKGGLQNGVDQQL